MKKIILSVTMCVLMTVNAFTVNATQSVGYKLWDSNNGYTATLVPSDLTSIQVNHIQIKFDGAISIHADSATLVSQFTINMASNRAVNIAVNALDNSILDITLSGDGTAQASSVLTVRAADESGAIPGIKDSRGNAVTLVPISSIQPTGLALEVVSSTVGTASVPASVTCRMLSIPLVRSMNFLQARSNKSKNAGGYLAREYFTIHSHNYSSMTVHTHFTTLTGAATVDTLQKAGYHLELIAGADADNPYIRFTALAPAEGEELSWIVYHYPYRAAADRKFELAQILDTAQVAQSIMDVAREVLYNVDATAEEVLAAIASLTPSGHTGISPAGSKPAWRVSAGSGAAVIHSAPAGSIITVYRINGQIVSTLPAKSAAETVAVPSDGVYIVRVNDLATKISVNK
jgi:hypothetical protein